MMGLDTGADMLQLLVARNAAVVPVLPVLQRLSTSLFAVVADVQSSLSYTQRMQLSGVLVFFSVLLLSGLRRLAPGWRRLILVPPVIAANIVLPLLFENGAELITRISMAFLFAWLANFKAVGLALDRGPLAMSDWKFPQLALLYTIPIYPTEVQSAGKSGRLGDSAGGGRQLLGRFLAQTALLVTIACLLVELQLPSLLRYYAYSFGLYGFISFLMTGPAVLLTSLANINVVPPFDAPWMSVSLADFWARRWNNTVGLTLRSLCYDPCIDGCLVRPEPENSGGAPAPAAGAAPEGAGAAQQQQQQAGAAPRLSRRRRFWGTLVVFVASGLAHELVLAYALKPYVWGVSTFFFVQAPLLQLESNALRSLKSRGIQPPWLLRWAATQAILMLCAHAFFFPPLERHTDTAQRVCAAVSTLVRSILDSYLGPGAAQ